MTQAGMIMGTAAYMAPEQARGRIAGKRADIWAFGCVLYEMLSGRRAFDADEVADVLARVLTQQPDWTALPSTVPAGIVRLLRRCLEKDPKRRLADIADARLDIDDALAQVNGDTTPMPTRAVREAGSSRQTKVAWAVAAFFAASALGLGISMLLRPVPAEAPAYRSTILVHENLSSRATSHRFKLSPDGRRLAYVALDASGRVMLWVRAFDSLTGQATCRHGRRDRAVLVAGQSLHRLLRRPEGQTDWRDWRTGDGHLRCASIDRPARHAGILESR